MRSRAPGRSGAGRSARSVPSTTVPFVERRSATYTEPSGSTVTAQCSRDTSGSSRGTSASAERPMRIWPPCSRCTPPASGPETTRRRAEPCGRPWAGAGPGPWRESTAPSIRGGSPIAARCGSSRSVPAYSTTGPPLPEPPTSAPEPATEAASEPATAASAVPAGAVTSTSQVRVVWPLRGPRTVSRICIAVNGPFCRDPTGGPLTPPTAPGHVGTYKSQVHVATKTARPHRIVLRSILAPATDNTPADRHSVILIGLLRAKKCLLACRARPDFDCRDQLGTVHGRMRRAGTGTGRPRQATIRSGSASSPQVRPGPPDRKVCTTALQWVGRAARS